MNKNKIITLKYQAQIVGHLALTHEHLAAFEYDSDWLRNGFSISPKTTVKREPLHERR